jgi:hypothetical protein
MSTTLDRVAKAPPTQQQLRRESPASADHSSRYTPFTPAGKGTDLLIKDLGYCAERFRVYRTESLGSEVAYFGTPLSTHLFQLGLHALWELAVLLEEVLGVNIEDSGDSPQCIVRDDLFFTGLEEGPPGAGEVVAGFLCGISDLWVLIGLAGIGHDGVQQKIDLLCKRSDRCVPAQRTGER